MNLTLSGHTTPFAVLGHPIDHTLSPVMHNAALAALGMDAIYLAFDVAPDNLIDVLHAMAHMGFAGVNLTVPLKEVAFRGIRDLDDSAQHLGAVNTVHMLPGGLRGYNTDGTGFLAAVREAFDRPVADLSEFILGNGGAGRAVAIASATAGAKHIRLSDQDQTRSHRLKDEITGLAPQCLVEVVPANPAAWTDAAKTSDLVVQATPRGMKQDDESLLRTDAFRREQYVYDLVYMYPETAFMRAAKQAGAQTANGLGMLCHQGARAFAIWTNADKPHAIMRTALEKAVYGKAAAGAIRPNTPHDHE